MPIARTLMTTYTLKLQNAPHISCQSHGTIYTENSKLSFTPPSTSLTNVPQTLSMFNYSTQVSATPPSLGIQQGFNVIIAYTCRNLMVENLIPQICIYKSAIMKT